MELVKLVDVSKTYGENDAKVEALKNVSLTIDEGELVAIVGSSGSGKSTLLNIIGCIDRPTEGQYFISEVNTKQCKERELAKYRNKFLGFILQYFGLVNSYTVYENVELPLVYSKSKNKKKKIIDILKKLGIEDKVNKLPSELSGGQNQRVAIARALVNNPKIILADEPTGALDKRTSQQVMDILLKLNEEGKTIIIVTHDENIAKQCSRTIIIEDGCIKENLKDEKAK